MSTEKYSEERWHRQAAHDLPLLHLLIAHHCTMIIAAYDPAIQQRHPLANASRMALGAVEELKNKLHEQARTEYPEADWLQNFKETEEYSGDIWPPRIIGSTGEVKTSE